MNISRHDWWAMPIWQFDIPNETSDPTLLESECRFYEQERAGIQMGTDIAKNKAQMDLQARTAALQNSRNQGSRK